MKLTQAPYTVSTLPAVLSHRQLRLKTLLLTATASGALQAPNEPSVAA